MVCDIVKAFKIAVKARKRNLEKLPEKDGTENHSSEKNRSKKIQKSTQKNAQKQSHLIIVRNNQKKKVNPETQKLTQRSSSFVRR